MQPNVFHVKRWGAGAAVLHRSTPNLIYSATFWVAFDHFTKSYVSLLLCLWFSFRRIVAVGGRGKRVGRTAEVNMVFIGARWISMKIPDH